jgi:predicted P-loop ATPase
MQGNNIPKGEAITFIESNETPEYDPFQDYIDTLPPYDHITNHNYIQDIADLIQCQDETHQEMLKTYFLHWFVGYYANALGLEMSPMILSFIGDEQIGKSYFTELIVPKPLRREYKSKIDFSNIDKDTKLRICEFVILEADELEYLPKVEAGRLKSFLSGQFITERAAYARQKFTQVRRASFLGSSNTTTILSDPTSSRRYPTVIVKKIHFQRLIDDPQLLDNALAQARYLYNTGFNIHFDNEFIKTIMRIGVEEYLDKNKLHKS